MTDILPEILAGLTIGALAYAAWSDIALRIVPNGTSIAIAACGLLIRALIGPTALAWSVGLSLVLFAVLVAAHARGLLGGGDVKLITAIAMGLSAQSVLQFLTITALAGGGLALLHLLARRLPHPSVSKPGEPDWRRVFRIERWRIRRHAPLPYGVAIAIAGTWAVLSNLGS